MRQIPIPDYLRERGHELQRGRGKCPIHGGDGYSFSVSQKQGSWLWHCFSQCDRGGDIIDLDRALYGGNRVEAAKRLLGVADSIPIIRAPRPVTRTEPEVRRSHVPSLAAPTHDDLREISERRSICQEALDVAVNRRFLHMATISGHRAWVLTDSARKTYLARRLDGEVWDDLPSKPKARILAGGRSKWAIGCTEACNYPAIALVEGGPDFLAAFGHMVASDVVSRVAPVCMPAAQPIDPECIQYFKGKKVRVFTHDDEAGYAIAKVWKKQLAGYATVDGFAFGGWIRSDGRPVKDFNDVLMIDYDCWEENRGEIESMFNYAEVRK